MNREQTRDLGIEFERRLQTIDPTEKILTKVDTEDIYSYLNLYQELYIKQLYTLDLQAESGTRPSNRIQDILQPLTCIGTDKNPKRIDDYRTSFSFPDNYWLYSRVNAEVTGTYKNYKNIVGIPCILLKQNDITKIIDSGFDKDRIIRTPIISLTLIPEIIHDRYTKINSVVFRYIRKPEHFGILENEEPCELPMSCFDDLVNGAVDLYFNDKYKLAIASQAAKSRDRRNDDDDNTQKQ